MKIYALANELNLDRSNTGTITVPTGTWDYGEKKLDDGRTLFFRQTLTLDGARAIASQIAASIAAGEKGVPVYWGHPDVPELAHKYPDKRAKGWIKGASISTPRNGVDHGSLVLTVEWLEENATEGFGWFSPYWTGPVTETGDGQAMMNVNALASVALVNMPNIQEFRLANELQDGFKDNEREYAVPQNLIELSRRYDARMAKLANEFDESKHPRDEQGQFTDKGESAMSSESLRSSLADQFKKSRKSTSVADPNTELNQARAQYRHEKDTQRALRASGKKDNIEWAKSYKQRKIDSMAYIQSIHKAAILAGFKYNPVTRSYE